METRMGKILFALNIISAVLVVITIALNGVNGIPNNGLFITDVGNISDRYPTDITPIGLTFSIWGVIFTFQLALSGYAVSNLFRKNDVGRIFENPVILDAVLFASYIAANVCNIGFLFAFDREQILIAGLCVIFVTIFGFVALSRAFLTIDQKKNEMNRREYIASQVLIVNGMDVYFTWTYIASCVSIAMILQHSKIVGLYMDPQVAGTIGLSIFLTGSVVFYVLDVTSFFETCKWMYMGYITILWALSGVLVNHYDITDQNTIITIVAIVITVIFLLAKILMTIFNVNPWLKFKTRKTPEKQNLSEGEV